MEGYYGAGDHRGGQAGISYGFQQPPASWVSRCATFWRRSNKKLLPRAGLCLSDPGGAVPTLLDREVDASLSGGEVKRIEIATILARNSALMIFDEPEAGIDLWSFAQLTETFEQLHAQHSCTMIIISHQERIIQLADEIVVVSDGSIAHQGSVEDIFPIIMADSMGCCPVINREVRV